MRLIKGREIADNILTNIKNQIKKQEIHPTLAVILIGENPASKMYVSLKEKAAKEIGINFLLYKYEESVEQSIILKKIEEINSDIGISGVIVQLPLPGNLSKNKIINTISPKKDVDGFCDKNRDNFLENKNVLFPVFPKAIVKMVESALLNLENNNNYQSVIICNSVYFATVMQEAFCKIKIKSQYFLVDEINENKDILREADIVVVACGVPNLLNSNMTKGNVIVIDGGINKAEGKTVGDVDIDSFKNTNALISPVPGGVGPVTVACLLENTYLSSRQ